MPQSLPRLFGGTMSEHVRYIDRTRDYYLSEGYEKPYEWAHHTDAPFTRLKKPLSECRVAIVSTSDIAVAGTDGERDRSNEFSVGNVYSLPSDTPLELLYSRQEHYDQHATTLEDVNAYYPVARLQELVESGRIGSLAPRFHGVYTGYSKRKTVEVDAPEALRRCIEDEVDVAVMTPV
ncbi:MAG: D-proline reductase (dithiol) PrdB [Candidatus Poriferisodalaceae bacterium]|jgi:D-proline reductase (dithiol) PrdB